MNRLRFARRVSMVCVTFGLLVSLGFAPFGFGADDSAPAAESGAATTSFDLSKALEAYKKGDLAVAQSELLALDAKYPGQLSVLNNLALIAVKKGSYGAAIGLWRKAETYFPTESSIESSIQWALQKLPKTEIAREYDTWEGVRQGLLLRTAPTLISIASAVFLVVGGWLLIRWWALRKRALSSDSPLPSFPLGGSTLLVLFLFLFLVLVGQFLDRVDLRGTIVEKKVDVRSAASPNATALFEIFEGMEVLILDSRTVRDGTGETTWRRIHYPGGMTGWVLEKQVLATVDPSERAFR